MQITKDYQSGIVGEPFNYRLGIKEKKTTCIFPGISCITIQKFLQYGVGLNCGRCNRMQTDMTTGKPMKMVLDFTIPVFLGNCVYTSCTVWQMQLLLESLLEPRGWQR